MRHLIHFAEDSDSSGFFPALAKFHDRNRYRMTFATLKPMAPWLEDFFRERNVGTYSTRALSRFQYPVAIARLTRYGSLGKPPSGHDTPAEQVQGLDCRAAVRRSL